MVYAMRYHKGEDEYCSKILLSLIIKGQMRFNELYNYLTQKMDTDLSRPTLVDHLKHLQDKKLVTRKEEGFQTVIYSLNAELFDNRNKIYEEMQKKSKDFFEKQEKTLFSLPLEEQVEEVIRINALRELDYMKNAILYKVDHKFENKMMVIFAEAYPTHYSEGWVVKKCIEDKEYREKILQHIEELYKRFGGKRL